MKLVTTRVGDCCNAHIFLTHFSIIRQLIIGSHSDYHLLGNNPSAALYGRHLPLHKGGFGRSRASGGPVRRWIMRQWGPRGSPASAGSPGRGGAAERLRFPPTRRKQRMRSLRRRGGGIDAGQYPFALHFSTNQQPTVGNRSSNSTPAGGTIFLLVKKDSGERHAKGPAGPIGSPG